ncbi:MAG TPA: DUF1289 domain-containing protein [Steroidobacteraceae bacterium]|nr:DUF1289 domain-containing protein [Steroidobacteraceae bacterium]
MKSADTSLKSADAALKPAAVASPCVNICRLDAQGLCIGCRRTLSEIAEWSQASDARRLEILVALKTRALRP